MDEQKSVHERVEYRANLAANASRMSVSSDDSSHESKQIRTMLDAAFDIRRERAEQDGCAPWCEWRRVIVVAWTRWRHLTGEPLPRAQRRAAPPASAPTRPERRGVERRPRRTPRGARPRNARGVAPRRDPIRTAAWHAHTREAQLDDAALFDGPAGTSPSRSARHASAGRARSTARSCSRSSSSP